MPENAWIDKGMTAIMVRRRFDFLKLLVNG
jgi:hypothetical protein